MKSDKEWPVAEAADRIRKRRLKREELLAERRQRARQLAAEVALNLGTADPTIDKIYGFGSTFESWRKYRMDSDIDLAIVGGDWSKAMSRIPACEFEVSLIELELQNTEFIEYVRAHGITLYEQ